jgi:hypothetical protein
MCNESEGLFFFSSGDDTNHLGTMYGRPEVPPAQADYPCGGNPVKARANLQQPAAIDGKSVRHDSSLPKAEEVKPSLQ